MKNQYAQELIRRKKQRSMEDAKDGFDFALQLCAVALNEKFGFGNDRLTVLENEITRLLEVEFGSDMEKASYGLAKRISQIRGDSFGKNPA